MSNQIEGPDRSEALQEVPVAESHSLPGAPVGFEDRANLDFPVVGIGASAGGIDALSRLFRAASPDTGMAFVVIQHLPPDHTSLMPEILARCTTMRVQQIDDGMVVEPNSVYVIRPGFTVTIVEGALRLREPVEKRGHRRPVDDLFRSLAVEQKERAIIVVLSGTGTNGTAGAQAVKAAGGLCIAQDPDSAEFPGMPHSLVHSGYADEVLTPEEMVPFLVRFTTHQSIETPEELADEERSRAALREIHALLRVRTGNDFRGYRKPTMIRRIQRRMGVVGAASLVDYVRILRENVAEPSALANGLMINVTGFFRDPDAWEALRDAAIVPLVANHVSGMPIRAWVTACASGEEPYSLAMLIAEEFQRIGKPLEAKIFATDTAEKSLLLARAGIYPTGIEGDISQRRLERFFEKDEHTYRIKKEIRDAVIFAPQNILRDAPFSRVDICTCRNLLIYLEPETQRHVLDLFSFSLRDGGYLFLGNTESVGVADQSFETVSKRWRIFRRVGARRHRIDVAFASRSPIAATTSERRTEVRPSVRMADDRAENRFERALLDEFAPPTLIIDHREHVLFIHGDVSPFLTFPSGELTTSISEIARPALRASVRAALRNALTNASPASSESPLDAGAGAPWVRVTAAPIGTSGRGRTMRVSFEMKPAPDWSIRQVESDGSPSTSVVLPADPALEDEIRVLRRELQASIEAFEASNEELKSSNEEVLSVNEELQSANEELETGNEEVQAINEELSTLNAQLQGKLVELEQTTNDLSNLLSSTNIAVVFLDTNLMVRRFTPAMEDLIALIPSDIGRPISALAPKFVTVDGGESPHHSLRDAASGVLRNWTPNETEVRSHSGKWYLQRTLPYRTSENRLDGVVVSFIDITRRREDEHRLLELHDRLETALAHTPAAIMIVDASSARILHANRGAATLFGQTYPTRFIDKHWETAIAAMRGWSAEGRLLKPEEWPLARSLQTGESVLNEHIEINFDDGTRRVLSVSSSPVVKDGGPPLAIVATFWDVTDLKVVEKALRESDRRMRLIVESAHDFAILMLDTSGRLTAWSSGASNIFGWSESEVIGESAEIIFTPADRDAGVPEKEMRTALRDGRASDDRWHLRKDGTTFWANGVLSVARGDSGELQGFVKILRDNTERKAAEDRLYAVTQDAIASRAQAETANRAKDDFISMVSHELRTPLNTMSIWMKLLRNKALPEKDRDEGTRILQSAVSSQQQLIDDLLDVSRISAGKLRLDVRPTQLNDAIASAVETVRPIAVRKGVELTCLASPSVGVVRADPDRIQQVVWNLLSNAVKFTPSRGSVSVEVDRAGDVVVIQVSDTGIGIREDLLPNIFERFHQGESGTARQHTGLGLGLAIAKQLIELHRGTITATSEGAGKGTTVTVRLPLEVERVEDDSVRVRAVKSNGSLEGVRVLLVEDESSTREAARRLIASASAEVQAVGSASAAREAFIIQPPDIVVSDIGMPGEDGYVLMQRIRAREKESGKSRVPALALTAFAREEDRQLCFAAGFDAHLPKPVDPDELIRQIALLTGRLDPD